MGLEIFIIFALKCSNILAWAVLGFLYPMYVSIHVMDTETLTPEVPKLLVYWICFSAVTLIENVCGHQLLRCLPIWPIVRLFGVYLLARHDFNGAHYIYKNSFPRFFKSEDVQSPTSFPEQLSDRDDIGQSTEGVIDNADVKCQDITEAPNAVDNDIDTIEDQVEERSVSTEANKNCVIDPDHSRSEERRSEDYLAITESLNEIKNDASLILQMIGRSMQEANFSAIMDTLRQIKNDASLIPQMGRSMQDVHCRLCGDRSIELMSIKSHLDGGENTSLIRLLKEDGVEMRGSVFMCSICGVRCSSWAVLKSHLNGRQHYKKSKKSYD